MLSKVKVVVVCIILFLKKHDCNALCSDPHERKEVSGTSHALDLLQVVRTHCSQTSPRANVAMPPEGDRAEQLKNEGNELMRANRYRDALDRYTSAIEIDASNAVYFCNRAAAHHKLDEYEAAVSDCTAALALQPDYTKAHSRIGFALAALERHREARAAFARAVALEPDNKSYRHNLRLADERLAAFCMHGPQLMNGLLQNPILGNMANELRKDPNIDNLISNMTNKGMPVVREVGEERCVEVSGGAKGMRSIIEAGQKLVQQIQATNPEFVEQLRQRYSQQLITSSLRYEPG